MGRGVTTTPVAKQRALIRFGARLAKRKKAGTLGKPRTLISIMRRYKIGDPRVAKRFIIKGIENVVGEGHGETFFDEIFSRGKPHKSADDLRNVGGSLGMMWLAGIREGWQSLEDIMDKYHVAKRHLAKKYIIQGLTDVLGAYEAKMAYDRIFNDPPNADAIRLEGKTLALKHKLGTLRDPATLASYVNEFGPLSTVRPCLIEGIGEIFGEKGGEDVFKEIFPHALKEETAEALREKGRVLAKMWRVDPSCEHKTLTDYMHDYGVRGRDVVGKYILEGMTQVLGEADALVAYSDLFSTKANLETQDKEYLNQIGRDLGEQWKQGKRMTTWTLAVIMDKHGISDIRTAKRHILTGLQSVLGEDEAEIAIDVFFGLIHRNAVALQQLGEQLAYKYIANLLREYKTIKQIAEEYEASEETAGKYLFWGVVAAVGELRAGRLFEKIFPHDLHAVVGVYNHLILEKGLKEVIQNGLETGQPAPVVTIEKFEENVKHDILIENVAQGDWFRKQLSRLVVGNRQFLEELKLTEAEAAQYTRVSVDFTTWNDPERMGVKSEKYADEDTLLIIALTGYADTLKNSVKIPRNHPHVRIVSAEFLFHLFGAETSAIVLVRKIRDLTRQGKIAELRTWHHKLAKGTAPSFLMGQQSLDQWLENDNDATASQEENADLREENAEDDEKAQEVDDGGNADATERNEGRRENEGDQENSEDGPEQQRVDRDQTEKRFEGQYLRERERGDAESREQGRKVGEGKRDKPEPEKIQDSTGLIGIHPTKRTSEVVTEEPDSAGKEVQEVKSEAEVGDLVLLLVPPPTESPLQEMAPLAEQGAGVTDEFREETAELPLTNLETFVEMNEMESERPAVTRIAEEIQETRPAPVAVELQEHLESSPEMQWTETQTPEEPESPVTQAQDANGIQELLPNAPQTPLTETRELEETLTESPIAINGVVAERPTREGKSPSELDLRETKGDSHLPIKTLDGVPVNATGGRETRDALGNQTESGTGGPGDAPKIPNSPDLTDLTPDKNVLAGEEHTDYIRARFREWIQQQPGSTKRSETQQVQDYLDRLRERAVIYGDPDAIDRLTREVLEQSGPALLEQMYQETETAAKDSVDVPVDPEQLDALDQELLDQVGPEYFDLRQDECLEDQNQELVDQGTGEIFDNSLPAGGESLGQETIDPVNQLPDTLVPPEQAEAEAEALDQERLNLVNPEYFDALLDETRAIPVQEAVDRLTQKALDRGGPELLEQLEQEANDPANQLPEPPARDEPSEPVEQPRDLPDEQVSTPEETSADSDGNSLIREQKGFDPAEAPPTDISLEYQPEVPEHGPLEENDESRMSPPSDVVTLIEPVPNLDLPDQDHQPQIPDFATDLSDYDHSPINPEPPADIPDDDHLPGDGHNPADFPDYGRAPEDGNAPQVIPDYGRAPEDGDTPQEIPDYDHAPEDGDTPQEIPDYDRAPEDGDTPQEIPDYDRAPEDTPQEIPDHTVEPKQDTEPASDKPSDDKSDKGDHDGSEGGEDDDD